MTLYFTNCSKQKKLLIETDYVEDVYDEIEAFFEAYKIMPHIIEIKKADPFCEVWFGSMSERFVIEEIDENSINELEVMFQ